MTRQQFAETSLVHIWHAAVEIGRMSRKTSSDESSRWWVAICRTIQRACATYASGSMHIGDCPLSALTMQLNALVPGREIAFQRPSIICIFCTSWCGDPTLRLRRSVWLEIIWKNLPNLRESFKSVEISLLSGSGMSQLGVPLSTSELLAQCNRVPLTGKYFKTSLS